MREIIRVNRDIDCQNTTNKCSISDFQSISSHFTHNFNPISITFNMFLFIDYRFITESTLRVARRCDWIPISWNFAHVSQLVALHSRINTRITFTVFFGFAVSGFWWKTTCHKWICLWGNCSVFEEESKRV